MAQYLRNIIFIKSFISLKTFFCFQAAKCDGQWQVDHETSFTDGGFVAIVGNYDSAEECALRVYLDHPDAVGATWWTESAYTCEAIYGSKKIIKVMSPNTHHTKTCIFKGNPILIDHNQG